MRNESKPNCRGRQLGSRAIPFTRRYQKPITQVFMLVGIVACVKGNDPVFKNKTGKIQYTGGMFTTTSVVGRGGA